ncbi:polyprenyl synthetase family protein [Streptomyces sp. 8N114]|uniref:polyprenyl synthetase family protein n=1 Tax=Streptomyces sp. 8N114 TaxID=3457419 RepID=UPI003FD1B2F9
MTTAAGATPSDIRVAQQLCEHARRRTQPALREAVSRLPGPLAPAGAYQFGWQHTGAADGAGAASGAGPDSGKAVRPALTYLAAEALGAPSERAVPGAVAIELVHNFTLVHDDITDGDATRRGRPTLWKRFGVGPALLAGDSLHVLAMEALLRRRDDRSAAGAALLNRALLATMYGQVRDLSFVQRPWAGPDAVSVAEYRAAAKGKTGALLACAAALGALLAGGRPRQVARFAAFGRHMGVAFQCADDILGLWGDQRRTGKPVGNDLLLARKTIPVLLALTGDTPAAARLRELLTREDTPLTRQVLPEALGLIGEAGGEEATRREAEHQRELALRMLAAVPMPADVRGRFAAMAAYLTRRGS